MLVLLLVAYTRRRNGMQRQDGRLQCSFLLLCLAFAGFRWLQGLMNPNMPLQQSAQERSYNYIPIMIRTHFCIYIFDIKLQINVCATTQHQISAVL